jgi:hypothetical protein
LIVQSPGHTGAKLAPGIVRDAATTPFMAQLRFVIAGDDPESCEEARLAKLCSPVEGSGNQGSGLGAEVS